MPRPASFAGFPRTMISFFRGLARNNDRDWFTPRKAVFEEQVKKPMLELIGLMNQDLMKFAAGHIVEPPAKALYRIYRDTRFTNDKTPYKTHLGANFPRRGLPRHAGAGFYFSVSHKEIEVAGGVYLPGPEELTAVRKALARDGAGFAKLISDRKLTRAMGQLQGDSLSRLPKGYERCGGSEVERLVRLKQLYWYILLPAELALSNRVRREVIDRFRLMAPAMEWLNEAILSARPKGDEEQRPARPAPMW